MRLFPEALSLAWLAVGYVGIAVLIELSFADVSGLVPPWPDLDKLLHGVAYASLMLWFGQLPRSTRAGYALMLLALGAVLERLQGLTPVRSADLYDWFADAIGVVFALGLLAKGHSGYLERLRLRWR